ncbi:hypothetical protein GP486_004515, partial [Trichoglossum hirsutum]
MPKLKQLLCSVEHVDSNVPFHEYGTSYGDGFVQTHIVVPAAPVRFTLHLTSTGYIAPGMAMFVFMDGVYQCNRNVDGLVPPGEGTERSQTEIDFLVRQKEQMLNDDMWLGREWSFEMFNIADSTIAPPFSTVSATPGKGYMPQLLGTDPSSLVLGDLSFDGAADYRPPGHVGFGHDGIEEQSTRSGSKIVRFGDSEDLDQPYDRSNTHWGLLYRAPSTGAWHAMDGSYDGGPRRDRFRPDDTWERRTQAYEHYHEDWRNPNGRLNEAKDRSTLQDGGYYQRRNPCNHSRTRSPANNERRPKDRQRDHDGDLPSAPGPFVVDIGSGTYHPSARNHQGYDRRYHHPESEVEAREQYSNGHDMQYQYGRSWYGGIQGHWGGGGSGGHGIGKAGNSYRSFREPSQPPSPLSPIQGQRPGFRTCKVPSCQKGENAIDDRRDALQGGLKSDNDIGQSRCSCDNGGDTSDYGAKPDISNWVINDGIGTWRPPVRTDNNSGGAGRSAPDSPADNFNITDIGQGTWIDPIAKDQQRAEARNRISDTNRSSQRESVAHTNRGNDGGRRNDNRPSQRSNWSESKRSRGNEDSSRQEGIRSNDRGNMVGGGASDDRRDGRRTGASNRSECGKSKGNDHPSERISNIPNERDDNGRNPVWGGAKSDHRDQENAWKNGGGSRGNWQPTTRGGNRPNERGHNNESWNAGRNNSRSNDDIASRCGKGKATNHSNTGQEDIDTGERRNGEQFNWGGNGRNGGSAYGSHPNAEQGHLNNNNNNRWRSGNSSHHDTSVRTGGNDHLSSQVRGGHDGGGKDNRSTSGRSKCRGGNNGKSSYGGSAWGGGETNNYPAKSAKPNSDGNGWRANVDYTMSNRGGEFASHRADDNPNGDDGGGWGGGEAGLGHGDLNAASANDRWGVSSGIGKDWNGGSGNGSGNDNNGEDRGSGNNRSGDYGYGNINPGDQNGNIDGSNNNERWNGGDFLNSNSNSTNGYWGGPDNETGNRDNTGLDSFNYQTNDTSGNDTYAAGEANPTNVQQTDPAAEQPTTTPSHPSAQASQPYEKPYWASWKAQSERAQSPAEPNTGRKRANNVHIGDEVPLYSIHKDQLRNHSASHQ